MLLSKTRILKAILIALIFISPAALADTKEVVFPEGDGIPASYHEGIAFALEGRIGFVVAMSVPAFHILSFSVDDARVLDAFDLSADLDRFPPIANYESSLMPTDQD
jgi:hypothetical protein